MYNFVNIINSPQLLIHILNLPLQHLNPSHPGLYLLLHLIQLLTPPSTYGGLGPARSGEVVTEVGGGFGGVVVVEVGHGFEVVFVLRDGKRRFGAGIEGREFGIWLQRGF